MNRVHEKYAYVSHPDNLPLELSGNAKKKGALIKKEDYNGAQCSLNDDSRSLLLKKMSNNCHDFANTKSILPTSDNVSPFLRRGNSVDLIRSKHSKMISKTSMHQEFNI
jgi:hypothetical protein